MTYKYIRITCDKCKEYETQTVDINSDNFDIEYADMDAFLDCNKCWAKLMEPES